MTILTYQILHISGILILFLALGSMLVSAKPAKGAVIAHGVALLVILISGFGRMAKMKYNFDFWLIVKLAVWLLLGAALVVFKRGLLPAKPAAVLVAVLGIAAAWCAVYKPGLTAPAE